MSNFIIDELHLVLDIEKNSINLNFISRARIFIDLALIKYKTAGRGESLPFAHV